MARFVIQDKLYDTDKMELVGHVKKHYDFEGVPGLGKEYDCDLYRSKKGNFLLTHKADYNRLSGEAITETEAKELLMHHDYSAYAKLYGKLEEA